MISKLCGDEIRFEKPQFKKNIGFIFFTRIGTFTDSNVFIYWIEILHVNFLFDNSPRADMGIHLW